ncbi:ABC transporter permease [Microbacterium sp. JZ31]|uniref:ABC transporter permease n=1 Tax=Microbacterium sp. JZ31 TaxID=1906274 RepID=UPI0019344F9A|nr:ABC transporter permease [Microbacterium sp. JZ31]
MTAIAGALSEAWQELRVHRLRVLLSLIVVAVSVAAFTGVVALGQMVAQGFQEQMERNGGRPALVGFSAYEATSDPEAVPAPPDADVVDAAFFATTERFGVNWAARVAQVDAVVPSGTWVSMQAVDPDYGVMRRVPVLEGRWFAHADGDRLVPAVVISENWWQALGEPPMPSHPTVTVSLSTWSFDGTPTAPVSAEAVVVGVTTSTAGPDAYNGYIVYDDATAIVGPALSANAMREAWIPVEGADALMEAMKASMTASLPRGMQTDAQRTDFLFQQEQGGFDPFGPMFLILGAIAALILTLGGLSLLNITLVTVRHRIREIGVRRGFGATGTRVFFSVMLESVVATVIAGGMGIVIAILVLRMPLLTDNLFADLQEPPAFPMSAAVTGLLVSAGVGALAGLLPALVAVRVRPIDAIRY